MKGALMTNEELVQMIQQGNADKIEELWEHTERLITLKARQYLTEYNFSWDFLEDLQQAGYIALVNAIAAYKDIGYKFTTFLNYHLLNAFREALNITTDKQASDPLHHARGLDAPIEKNGELFSLADIVGADDPSIEDAEDRVQREELREILLEEISKLPAIQADTITKYYWGGLTYDEIAASENVSRELIRQRKAKAIRTLRRRAKRSGLSEFLEELTPYYKKIGVNAYQRTRTSAVEALVIRRAEIEERWKDDKN